MHLTSIKKESVTNPSPIPTDKAVTLQHFHHTFRERSLDLRTVSATTFFRSCLGCAVQFHPKDVVADKRTVHRLTTAVFCSFRNETNTYTGDLRCIHLICRVSSIAVRGAGVVESTQTIDLHAASLCHIIGQNACQIRQDSIDVSTTHGRNLRQSIGYLFRRYRFAHGNCLRMPLATHFFKNLFKECHN